MASDGGHPGSGPHRARAAYFAAQAIATAGWWTAVAWAPAVRRVFAFGDAGESLLPFLPADMLLWVGGSLAAAWGDWSGAAWTPALRHALCGALACSVLHAVGLAIHKGAGWPGAVLMAPALAITAWLTWQATPSGA